jgi:hypothetical protein
MVNNTMVVLFPGTGEGLPGWDRLFPGTAGVSPAPLTQKPTAGAGPGDPRGAPGEPVPAPAAQPPARGQHHPRVN